MLKFLKKMMLGLSLLTVVGAAHAETADQFIKTMSDQVLAAIRSNPGLKNGSPSAISTYVDGNIMPHVNFRSMVSRVVGPAWNKASAAEQNELMVESRRYLVRTYAGGFKGASINSIDVYPANGNEVRTRINTSSGAKMVTYRLENNGGWKVNDLSVAGVWLVQSYAGQFRPIVAKGGVPALISYLKSK
ncbi:MlaC/ttg2D family ABC transporter substrate-binding protein [Hydromonas duriensis]|uniref:Phospholipid transport system substrate-binding protein n=1 Tax=Hydromonas duriensis TaxID=1527608 RepID=A0A4R6Y350_9BURK|nr:ABC transporter substrate-binding protein [Hydromonas duriensis]TDR30976.1 phospholipid transport system substrate-binding protein [Hydromonas duriensis]